MPQTSLDGAWTALVTPFDPEGRVDWKGFQQNLEFQISQGITGILPVGTTGESPTLSWEEHEGVIDRALRLANGRTGVLAGTGSNSTEEAIAGTRHAHESGADAVLLVDCYYNGPSSLELRREYYEAVLEAVPGVRVVPYIIPGRTGCQLSVEDLAILSGTYPGVQAVKEATGDLERMRQTRAACGPDFRILSGDDDLTYQMMTDPGIRAAGVISVISNVAPGAVERLTRAVLGGRKEAAEQLLHALSPLFGIVTVKAQNERCLPNGHRARVVDKFRNPLPIKTLLNGLGLAAGPCRRPLGRMTAAGVSVVREAARETHRRDPSVLQPLEAAYGVRLAERLESDAHWAALAY